MTPTEVTTSLRRFNAWRRGDEDIPQPDPREIGEVIDAAVEMIERLEAAEKERDAMRAEVQTWQEQAKAYWSKITEMERQEPVAKVRVHRTGGNAGIAWSVAPLNDFDSLPLMRDGDRLYALPGAQNTTKAVAYLDLGVGGYMDVGTDLTDEELAALPKGRHMLGVIGTYGVDGYVPAQPAPSVPVAALRPVIDWLRNGCDPARAADELEMLAAAPKLEGE